MTGRPVRLKDHNAATGAEGDEAHYDSSFAASLRRLLEIMPAARTRQMYVFVALVSLTALAELVSLGSVIPFLALIFNPDWVPSHPIGQKAFGLLDWLDPSRRVYVMSAMFCGTVFVAGVIRLLTDWFANRFAFGLGHDLGVAIYRSVLYRPYIYHITTNTSEIIEGVNKAQLVTVKVLLPLILATISSTIAITLFAGLVAIYDLSLLGIFAALGSAYAVFAIRFRPKLQKDSRTMSERLVRRTQAIQEGLGGIRDVIVGRSQPVYIERFAGFDGELRDALIRTHLGGTAPRYVIETLSIIGLVLIALILTLRADAPVEAIPILGALTLAAQRILPAIHRLYHAWVQAKANQDHLRDVLRLIGTPAATDPAAEPPYQAMTFNREIRLTDVGFRYTEDASAVFSGIDLVIAKGARLALVGKTGSGKSTIADLVIGILEPTSGVVSVDGQALDSKNRGAWQAHIAHVAQDVFFTDASLAENIAFGVPPDKIDWDLVRHAAKQAALSKFAESLPKGFDTVINERGIRLSGGQRQRIGIARAVYRRADVLILDEATSALDHQTEAEVLNAIQGLDENMTIIVIAHRPSAVAICDQVFHVRNGKVIKEIDNP